MPRGKKKTYKRKRKNNIHKSLVVGGFPASQIVKLKYADVITLDCGVNAFAQDIYRANSVFDPYEPIGGHQPMRFDQWADSYNHYTVLSSKMTMTYAGTGITANGIPSWYGIILTDEVLGTGIYSTITDVFENKNVTNPRICGSYLYGQGSPNKAWVVSKNFSSTKFFGTKDTADGAAYGALINANPSKPCYFIPYTASIDGTDGSAVKFLIQIEYTVLFDQLNQAIQN